MIEKTLQKIRAWLTGSPIPGDRPLDLPVEPPVEASLLAQFIAALESEKLQPDYRELADLLWLENLAEAAKEGERTHQQDFFDLPDAEGKRPHDRPQPSPNEKRKTEEEQTPGASLYSSATKVVESERIPAMRVRLTAPPALPDALQIGRALKPFARRAKSNRAQLLNEDATAQASAECGLLVPVRQAAPERWFSVALVVEDAPSMAVWSQTARELFDLLRQHGAFYEIRQWRLNFDAGQPQLIEPSGTARPVRALRRSNGRQLVILLTDGASPRWVDGTIARTLETWSKDCSVVIAQALGERLWPRTRLGWPETEVKAELPGSVNAALRFPSAGWFGPGNEKTTLTPVPIVSLNPELINRWAKMLMRPGVVYRAAIFSASDQEMVSDAPVEDGDPTAPSPAARVAHFRALVSREARHLAIYLSVPPLTLPIMRLTQMTLLRNPRQEQLAELLLGGVIKRLTPKDAAIPDDEVEYDFYEGVRETLEKGIHVDELEVLLTAIGDYISQHSAGKSSLTALLPHPEGDESLPKTARPFAKFLIPALKRLGLEYLIGGASATATPAVPGVKHETFSFDTVTLDQTGKETARRTLRANQFVEELADGVTLEMVEIPGGKFTMGSPKGEADSYDSERPQRPVEVPPFYIGKFAVTQAQWRVVAGWEKVERELKPDPSRFKGDDRPVENVNWEDAKEFCARLAKKTGRLYRLPSESEWEYACRAGTITPFAFGETITHETVNYNSEYPYAKAKKAKYRRETIPVGSLRVANAFGLFDMHGNVWEWCEDVWHDNYKDAPTDGSAWLSGGDSSLRVLRGGSYCDHARSCRSAYRNDNDARYLVSIVGFRVVVSARIS